MCWGRTRRIKRVGGGVRSDLRCGRSGWAIWTGVCRVLLLLVGVWAGGMGVVGAAPVEAPGPIRSREAGPGRGPVRLPSVQELYQAIAEEKLLDARRMAEQLAQAGSVSDRQVAVAVYGRILLAQADKESARQYLAKMKRQTLDTGTAGLMEVYEAWLGFLEGGQEEAAERL